MLTRIKFIFICLFIYLDVSIAQTFSNNVGGLIPDNNTYISFPISISGITNNINTNVFGLQKVTLNIDHNSVGDLRIKLEAPDGTQYVLTSFNGGTGNDYTNTVFSDTSSISINNGTPPFNGVFHPVDDLALYNNGQNPNGIWKLNIRDANSGTQGSVISWSLTFSNTPAGFFNFTDSNLPIVVINTNGQSISNNFEIPASMGIIYNGPGLRNYLTDSFNLYNNPISIEVRGQSSVGFPQKQYRIETQDTTGMNLNVSLFGMPIENDWILYAPYNDKSLMRNVLTYKIARDMGQWAARTRFCEVVLNDSYAGVYVFMEKIKRDNGRVDIKKLLSTYTYGNFLTGGYIFSIDKDPPQWTSSIPPNNSNSGQSIGYHHVYPEPDTIQPIQSAYLQAYVDSFEQALNDSNFQDPINGYRKYASVKSFSDYFIINEISNNVDGYRLSTYLHKDRNSVGGLIKAGPVWDYNLAWHNANYCNGERYDVWAYQFNSVCPGDYWQVPFWWDKLVNDSAFQKQTYCRWLELRSTTLDTSNLFHVIDSMASEIDEAKERHFEKYSILGNYVWPNPSPLATSYDEEIRNTKDWIVNRLAWLDSNMIGKQHAPCSQISASIQDQNKTTKFSIFPNPTKNYLRINIEIPLEGRYRLEVYDLFGNRKHLIADEYLLAEEYAFSLNTEAISLENGVYFIRLTHEEGKTVLQKFIKE